MKLLRLSQFITHRIEVGGNGDNSTLDLRPVPNKPLSIPDERPAQVQSIYGAQVQCNTRGVDDANWDAATREVHTGCKDGWQEVGAISNESSSPLSQQKSLNSSNDWRMTNFGTLHQTPKQHIACGEEVGTSTYLEQKRRMILASTVGPVIKKESFEKCRPITH